MGFFYETAFCCKSFEYSYFECSIGWLWHSRHSKLLLLRCFSPSFRTNSIGMGTLDRNSKKGIQTFHHCCSMVKKRIKQINEDKNECIQTKISERSKNWIFNKSNDLRFFYLIKRLEHSIHGWVKKKRYESSTRLFSCIVLKTMGFHHEKRFFTSVIIDAKHEHEHWTWTWSRCNQLWTAVNTERKQKTIGVISLIFPSMSVGMN